MHAFKGTVVNWTLSGWMVWRRSIYLYICISIYSKLSENVNKEKQMNRYQEMYRDNIKNQPNLLK